MLSLLEFQSIVLAYFPRERSLAFCEEKQLSVVM